MRWRRGLGAATAVAALAFAGCGGGADEPRAPITAGTPIARQAGLLGDQASAGTATSYEPQGEILADSGFRPATDGFAFENYGNDVEPENLTPAQVQSLFGDQVCIGGDGEDCKLIPPAERWMQTENERMAGGHCMGFSVAAIRMYQGNLDSTDFGARRTSALKIQGNTDLQSSIAEHWVYQDLPRIQRATVEGTPRQIVQRLVDTLDEGEDYTLGIFKADGSAGHAITPFAVEDKGDDRYAVLVYDNNFPGIIRAIEVDAGRNTWRYVGGTNPKDLDEVYTGDAQTRSMLLLPTSPGEEVQPCPFCRASASGDEGDDADLGTVLPAAQRYTEITLRGDAADHPHLVLEDDRGRRTGIVGGRLLREIPGVRVVQPFSVRNWEAAPEPKFQVPNGLDVLVNIDGRRLKGTRRVDVDVVGNGLVISAEEIRMAPGQQDALALSGGGYGFYYTYNGETDDAPELFAALEDGDAAYQLAASAVAVGPGSVMGLLVDRKSGTVVLDADGTEGTDRGRAQFIFFAGRATAERTDTWATSALRLDGARGDGVTFNFRETPRPGKSLDLFVGPDDGSTRVVKARYER